MMHTKNRKLPAWFGSILVHAVLLLLILFWFTLPSADRSAPGERVAAGILVQSGGGAQQQTETSPADSHIADSELLEIVERIASVTLTAPTIAPGQELAAQPAATATGEVSEVLTGNIGNQTGDATVQLFGQNGTGRRFVFVFDRSASMEGPKMQRARAELSRGLNALGDTHQFNIIFYNHETLAWRPRLTNATPQDKQNAVRFIEGITAIGRTLHFPALMMAINQRPDVIFFLTDGVEGLELTSAHLEIIRRENNQRIQINVIEFGDIGFFASPSPLLEQLARENRGEYIYVR